MVPFISVPDSFKTILDDRREENGGVQNLCETITVKASCRISSRHLHTIFTVKQNMDRVFVSS